ncbi:MAG: FadR/GntR family transcriptional regulator [Kiloniellaceae bacterium]
MPLETADEIREYLRGGLSAGQLAPGQRLPTERGRAERFAVSRAAVRHALTVLEVEGWIQRRAGSGTYLKPAESNGNAVISSKSANAMTMALATSPSQILEARTALEVTLAELAVVNATEHDLRDIRSYCAQLSADLSPEEFEISDRLFHRAIAVATHNELLLGCFDLLNAARDNPEWRKLKSRRHRAAPERREAVAREHQAVVEAIAARDIEAAKATTLEHMAKVRLNLLGY